MIFFDNASTTQIDKNYLDKINQLNDDYYFNPGAIYSKGRNVRKIIDNSREIILTSLNADGYNIVFTGSATEANNLALFGNIKKNTKKILVSMGEHPSVYNTALELKNRGFCVEFINLNSSGVIDIDDYISKLTPEVDLISIMHVSNETGAINDIAKLVKIARDVNPNVIFHCDGVQAVGKIDVDIEELDVDFYTMSAHKIHGFKGVGALCCRKSIRLKPIIFGGGQESGLRSGTENLIGINSLSYAIENQILECDKNLKFVSSLKNRLIEKLETSNLKYKINSSNNSSPYIISISLLGCRAETILNLLSDNDIYVGNGSACSSKNSDNRILSNMGISRKEIEGNIRVSFSKNNTIEEVDRFVEKLSLVVKQYLNQVV